MYVPVLPTILVNGSSGIGTGWSSEIPNYNPLEIIENIRLRMNEGASKEDMKPMIPWYKGFTGTTEELGNDRFQFTGTIRQTGDNEIEVTELPVRYWTQDFKDKLEDIIKAEKTPSFIKDYMSTTRQTVCTSSSRWKRSRWQVPCKRLEEMFKLSSRRRLQSGGVRRSRPHSQVCNRLDIMEEFYHVRLR